MFRLILIVLIICFNISFGQNLGDYRNNADHQYYPIEYKIFQEKLSFFSLDNIENSTSKEVFRFQNTTHCVQIEKSENILSGKVIFAIRNVDNKSEFLRKEFSEEKKKREKFSNKN